MATRTADEKRRLIAERHDWYHSIPVGDGLTTPGRLSAADLQAAFASLRLPDDLSGQRVLDIGTQDGFHAFECERRGAEVVAVDVNPADCHCFALAKELLGSRVTFHQMSVYGLDLDVLGGPFDWVLCLGVYYHLRHLFVALDQLWVATKRELRLETHVIDENLLLADGTSVTLRQIDPRLEKTPLYRFYRFNELGNDYSNWFGGNIAAVEECLSSAGFLPELLGTCGDRALFRAVRNASVPREWEVGSYEGTHFERKPDGTWVSRWIDPQSHGLPDRMRR